MCAFLEHVEDGIVHLREDGQVDGEAGAAVLCRRVARQPGEGVVLLQYKPAGSTQHLSDTVHNVQYVV